MREDRMFTSIKINKNVWRRLKVYCAINSKEMSQTVENALTEHLDKLGASR